ncbi:MAG: hypothetical protein OEV72_08040 [Thermoleophilia bacterium]|nr:hypothetical protein [Thermoleophilia bacterium]
MTAVKADAPGFVGAAGLLSLAMLFASGANYALNLFLARRLPPGAFGDATLIVTLLLGLTAVAVALQLVSAHMVSTALADHDDERHATDVVAGVRRWLLSRAWIAGIAAAVAVTALAPVLSDRFRTDSALPFVLLAVGLPVHLAQSVDRGVLQGGLCFTRLACSFVAEAVVRFIGGIVLVSAGLGVDGATLALTASFVASWLVVRPWSPEAPSTSADLADRIADARLLTRSTAILLTGQIIVNNVDVIIAKRAFEPDVAGRYAAVALMGRAVFFLSWAVVNAAFPLSVRESGASSQTMRWAVVTVGAISATLVGVIHLSAETVVPLAFGGEYRPVSDLFATYALATAIYAVVNTVATIDMARGRRLTPALVLAGGLVQTAVLSMWSDGPRQLVEIQVAVMAVLLVVVVTVRALPALDVKIGARLPIAEPRPVP